MVSLSSLLRPLDRKLLRDLWRMRGQAAAIAAVAMCGIASFVTMRSGYEALMATRAAYYEQYRFADVFATLKRAPESLLPAIREIPGVNEAEGRAVFDVSLDVPGLAEPASGRIVSLPREAGGGLNRPHLRSGRLPRADSGNEVLVSEAFAAANTLRPGSTLGAVINGRRESLRIVGIAISPEYINEMKGSSFPDNRRFGVLWMEREAVAAALDMRDSFNDVVLTLAPGASEKAVIDKLDQLLAPWGSLGAYGRDEQLSHSFLEDELKQNRVSSTVVPAIFLGVVAFLTHNVLLRTTALQRAQIALLKSFGYSRAEVAAHYMKFALITILIGTAAGIALGVWLGKGLAGLYTNFYHFPQLQFSLSAFTLATSVAVALLTAGGGALLAVRKVLALQPAEAMRPESPARYTQGPLERLGLQRFMALPLRIVLRNLERRPLKAMMSVLGLALAVALLVTGQFTFDALDEIIRLQFHVAQRDDVQLSFNQQRDASVGYSLAALPGVTRVETFHQSPVRLRFRHHAKKTVILGLPEKRELRLVLDQQERPVSLPREGLVLSKRLAETLEAREGDRLSVEFLDGERPVKAVRVAMIIDEPIGMFSYMDRNALARVLGVPPAASGAFLAVDAPQRETLYRRLKELPAVASVTLREATIESFLATVAENMKINTMVLVTFACVIAIGVVYNSARIGLSEHALELASLRILGFTRAEVGRMLLGEQALLTLAAIPLGCLLGYALSALIASLLSQELFRIPLVVSTRTFLMSAAVVLAAAVASGLLVWRKLQSLDLIEVLKTRE